MATDTITSWFDLPPTQPPLAMATDRDALIARITHMHDLLAGSEPQGKLLRRIDDTILAKGSMISFHGWEVTNHVQRFHPHLIADARRTLTEQGQQFDGSMGSAWSQSSHTGDVQAAISVLGHFAIGRPTADFTEQELAVLRMVWRLQAKGICDSHDVLFLQRCFAWNDGHNQRETQLQGEVAQRTWLATEYVLSRVLKRPQDAIGDFMQQITQIPDLFPEHHPVVADIRMELNVGNAWFLASDVQRSNNLTRDYADPRGLFLGSFLETDDVCFFNGEGSLMTIARPGMGKTQCHVLPNLRRYPGPAIVLDIKGECLEETGLHRQNAFGQVYVFGPSMEGSNSYNPLDAVRRDDANVWADASILASTLIIDDGRRSDPTWTTQARNLLTLLIVWACKQSEQANMADVMDLMAGIGMDMLFETLTDPGAKNLFPREMIRSASAFKGYRDASRDGQWLGYIGGMQEQLDAWNGHAITSITERSDWTPDVFNEGAATLYLNFELEEIGVYASVIRAIIGQHMKKLIKSHKGYDGPLPPLLVMLDEFPRLGEMEALKEALEFGRSAGIRLWMFAQNEAQIRDAYGADAGNGMMETCEAKIYMNVSGDTANALSKELGDTLGVLESRGKPLATPQDLAGPDYDNIQIAIVTGNRPVRLEKFMYHRMNWGD